MIRTVIHSGLPRTGQATSYRDGDDGYLETGLPGTTRFVPGVNNTVFDHMTGLEWVREVPLIMPGGTGAIGDDFGGGASAARGDWAGTTAYVKGDLVSRDGADAAPYFVCNADHTSGGAFAGDVAYWDETAWTSSAADLVTNSTMNWNTGIDNCRGSDHGGSGLSYNGHDDWYLPNWWELVSLYDVADASPPMINDTLFPNTAQALYWTSTTFAPLTNRGYACGWDWDMIRVTYRLKTESNICRPVRGGITN